MDKARMVISFSASSTRSFVKQQASNAERATSAPWDRTFNWITANPFSAIGLAISGVSGPKRCSAHNEFTTGFHPCHRESSPVITLQQIIISAE
jgi:hypothetical protein